MGSIRRVGRRRSDAELLDLPRSLELLAAIEAGEVVRGMDGRSTGVTAPVMWQGWSVRLDVLRLFDDDLVWMPISGPPRLTTRGERVLRLSRARGGAHWSETGTWPE